MRNWKQEQVVKKCLLGCYVCPEVKARIDALALAKRISISQLMRELIELALPQLELAPPQPELAPPQLEQLENQHDLSACP